MKSPNSEPSLHRIFANAVRSKWVMTGFTVPVIVYLLFLLFENEILAFAIPFFPQESDKSVGFYRDLLQLAFREMLWYTAFGFIAWTIWAYIPTGRLINLTYAPIKVLWPAVIILASFVVTVSVSFYTLDTFPNSSDEYVYVFQGETMSEGRLTEKAHALPSFFHFNHIAQKDGVRVGRFPPGWPVFLTAAFYTGLPVFLVNPILGLLTLILFYRFARKIYNEHIALWSLVVMAFSSYFIFTSASYFSHTSCIFMVLCFVYCIYEYHGKQAIGYAILAGFFIGMVITIRYYTAVLIFIPFFITLLYRYKLKVITLFFWMGIGCVPCLALLLWYNHSITGNFLLPVTMWAYADESLGFVRGHSFMKGTEHVIRWIIMFFYWCSPAMLILYGIYLWKKLTSARERLQHPEEYAFLFLIAGYFFYYEIGGNQYGPRFLSEALPFLILLVTRSVFEQKQKWAMALFLAGSLYAVVKLPFIAYREHQIILDRQDPYLLANSRKLTNAVVLISSRVCMIRPMPVGDLTRNDSEFENDILYAFDIPARNHELFKFYPSRDFYRYVRHPEKSRGELIKVDLVKE